MFELIHKSVKTFVTELLSSNGKVIVYHLERNNPEYELKENIIHESNLKKIKEKLKKAEKIAEEKIRREFKEEGKKRREEKIRELINIKEKSFRENEEMRRKLETEIKESERLNTEINNRHKEMSEIKDKLKDLQNLKLKLEKSKKEVNKIISKELNKEEYLTEMKKVGFILSYAGCLKIALNKKISNKDLVMNNKERFNFEMVASVIREQEKSYRNRMNVLSEYENEEDEDFLEDVDSDLE